MDSQLGYLPSECVKYSLDQGKNLYELHFLSRSQSLQPTMASVEFCQPQFCDQYVERTKRSLPDKFLELCHKHLARLLELSGDQLQLLLSGHGEHKKKSGLPSLGMFKKKDKSHGLFGLPLTDEGVCLMIPLIQFLKQEKNVTNEGLFRKPGSKIKMTALKELLIAHGPKVSIDRKMFSADDVASVLKEFLRELPEPLLTERHLEAHKHILALGRHAKTPEEMADYSSKKLSALQLLILLLPSPAQALTMHLVQLLQRVANSPESRMTSVTLGTIFAPIFFIERKVHPTDLYNEIITTAPGVSFIIDKANELFQPPKELVIDLAKFWKSRQQAFLNLQNRESDQMKKSLSGQTLDTNMCYADNAVSRCNFGASNSTKELGNCRRSRSIGSSVKKRLHSMRQLRQGDILKSRESSSSSSNSKTAASAWIHLFACSTDTSEAKHSSPKPGHKRRYTSDNCPTAVSSNSSDSPAKRKCQETATSKISLTVTGNQKHPNKAGFEALRTSSKSSANIVADFVKNRHRRSLPSGLEDPVPCDVENKENLNSATCGIKNRDSTHHTSHFNGKTYPGNPCMLQPHLGPGHTASSGSVAKSKGLSVRSDKPGCVRSETRNGDFPQVAGKKTTVSGTASRNAKPITNTRQQPSGKPGTTVKAHTTMRLNPDVFRETSV